MSTKERIQEEIKTLDRTEADELYEWLTDFLESPHPTKPESIFAQLRQIQIDGPRDLAENHDLYISGEKSVETDSN